VPRYGTPHGCRCTRTFLGAPPTPRFGVSEAGCKNSGANAPRERGGVCVLEIVRPGWKLPNLQKNRKIQGSDQPARAAAKARSRASFTRYGTPRGCLVQREGERLFVWRVLQYALLVLILRSAHAQALPQSRTRVRASRRMRTCDSVCPHASRRIAAHLGGGSTCARLALRCSSA
jgi:hypothetical protein